VQPTELTGAPAMEFLFPLSVGIGAVLFAAFTIVAVSPLDELHHDAEAARRYEALQARREQFAEQIEQQIAASGRNGTNGRRQQGRNVGRALR
jgi:hypothetical protein